MIIKKAADDDVNGSFLPHTLFPLRKKRLQRLVYLALLADHAVHELRVLDVAVGGH